MRRDDEQERLAQPCGRVEWRPSRWLMAALAVLGALAAVSLLASAMPAVVAWPAAAIVAGWGLWLSRRESRKARVQVRLRDSAAAEVDGVAVEDFHIAWRGPLAFACWRDTAGRRRRLAWWPDTLPPTARRELRLAAPVQDPAHTARSMAP